MARQVLTRTALRRILRRQVQIASAGPPRESVAATRIVLALAGEGEVAKGNAPTSGELHPPVIVLTEPPAR